MTTLLRWSANFLAGALITAIAFALLDRLDALALTFSEPALFLFGIVAIAACVCGVAWFVSALCGSSGGCRR